MTSRNVLNETEREEWGKSLIGKAWEIYWEPETPARPNTPTYESRDKQHITSSPSTSSVGTPIMDTDDDKSYSADWYDGHIKSYSHRLGVFEVVFVGEDSIYKMKLKPEFVRPLLDATVVGQGETVDTDTDTGICTSDTSDTIEHCERKGQNIVQESSLKWKQYLIGKDWEIYWDTKTTCSIDGQRHEEQNFDADWYDGNVQSYSPHKNTFQVSFKGEERVYQMLLGPDVVRPSVEAWIRRTKFLLDVYEGDVDEDDGDNHSTSDSDIDAERRQIPPSTATFEVLSSINHHLARAQVNNGQGDDHEGMRHFFRAIEEQILQRQYLTIPSDDIYNDTISKTSTEQYVNHLCQCLDLVKEACTWYQSNSSLIQIPREACVVDISALPDTEPQLQRETTSKPIQLEVEDVYNQILLGIHIFLRTLSMKTDLDTVCTKKRKNVPTIIRSRRLKKRRRYSSSMQKEDLKGSPPHDGGFALDGFVDTELKLDVQSNRDVWNSILQWLEDSFENDGKVIYPSFEIFQQLLGHLNQVETISRYCVRKVFKRLNKVLHSVWDEVMNWTLRTTNLLRCSLFSFLDDFEEETKDETDYGDKMFTLDDIYRAQKLATKDPLLRRFNLLAYVEKLGEKIEETKEFEGKAWSIIANCTCKSVSLPSSDIEIDESSIAKFDKTMNELSILQDEMKTIPSIANVEPIGILGRQTVADAVKVRKWVISFVCTQLSRERAASLIFLHSHKPNSINIPKEYVRSKLPDLDEMFTQLDVSFDDFIKNTNEHIPLESLQYDCEKRCRVTLDTLGKAGVLTECEEQLAVLADTLALKGRIQHILNAGKDNKVCFGNVKSIFNLLNNLRTGKSATRRKLTAGLMRNIEVDKRVQAFAQNKLSLHLGQIEKLFVDLYAKGKTWKEKSETVFQALKAHDNISVSLETSILPIKSPMVDIQRIHNLISEHESGWYSFQRYFELLSAINNEATNWLQKLNDILNPIKDFCPYRCLADIQSHQKQRPQGLLMYPPRHLVDSWIETLEWYQKSSSLLKELEDFHKNPVDAKNRSEFNILMPSSSDNLNSLILSGLDLLNEPTIDILLGIFDQVDTAKDLGNVKTTTKHVSRAKLQSCAQGQLLLQGLMQYDRKLRNNGIIARCRFILWERSVIKFTMNIGSPHQESNVTLDEAIALHDMVKTSSNTTFSSECNSLLGSIYEKAYVPLNNHIEVSEKIKKEANDILLSLNSLQQDSINPELLTDLLTQIEAIRVKIKASYCGLRIDSSIEHSIKKRKRDVLWLLSASRHRLLFNPRALDFSQDSKPVSVSSSVNYTLTLPSPKSFLIPWQTLVSIHDKMPPKKLNAPTTNIEGLDNIINKVCINLTKLKTAGEEWDAKVQKKLPLSTRGLKRRRRVIPEIEGKTCEKDSCTTTKELYDLSTHKILDYVSMPLESAVRELFNKTAQVKQGLNELLTIDLYGDKVDRSEMPSVPSLIGPTGEFLLYKLIGSSMFESMGRKLKAMNNLCKDICIETPEILTVKWLTNSVQWIHSLTSKLIFGKSGKLELSIYDAEQLALMGSTLFLGIEDVVKRCVVKHKVVVYTNKNTRNFSVRIAKGGATHSVGGYVLCWIEFCFNSLRGDIYLYKQFGKEAHSICSRNDTSILSLKTLSDMLEKGKSNLLIPPYEETISDIHEFLKRHDWPISETTNETKSKLELHHDLIT